MDANASMQSPTTTVDREKRRKVPRACDECKQRKRRCTGDQPCSACTSAGRDCTYAVSSHVRASSRSATTPIAVTVGTHELQSFRQSATCNTTRDSSVDRGDTTRAGHYLGPASPFAVCPCLCDLHRHKQRLTIVQFLRRASSRLGSLGLKYDSAVVSDAGASIFSYGDKSTPSISTDLWALPSLQVAKQLVSTYFSFATPTYRVLHEPSVEKWVDRLYENQLSGTTVVCLLYTSPSPRDGLLSRMPSSA